jgi:hypothetical protein
MAALRPRGVLVGYGAQDLASRRTTGKLLLIPERAARPFRPKRMFWPVR